ncbi:hypothetical protein HXA31_20230 [Salipaludibacillus agaradhaerens]|jgi:hypothetical protein|uniref:hypothetical protein n=1 Tax=Salipaludibacillus TaxID=1884449 RepID=UPI0020D097B3|nr:MULTISPECIES: hypothetical protein [Salipaludibacillus]MCR6116659.1 hypothetical protein [Salipaludibacillus agaradhaerens]UTR13464.1 hypothetical protein MM221_12585 [Salipaludibacillus sp. LMS25]
MLLRKMVLREQMLRELESLNYFDARDGRPLKELSYQELQGEYVRLPELAEVNGR